MDHLIDHIKKSKSFAYAKNKEYLETKIYLDET